MPEKTFQKMPNKFTCEKCDFTCSKKSNWDKHLTTLKHDAIHNHTLIIQKNAENYVEYVNKRENYVNSNNNSYLQLCELLQQ